MTAVAEGLDAAAGGLRGVLRRYDFRRLYTARLVTQTGDGMTTVALTSYVLFSPERQTSASAVAVAFATLLLPYSLVAPFAGMVLDRWRRRQVMLVASGVRALLLLLLATLVAHSVTGPAFFATGLAILSVNRFFLAALSAALPHVVDARNLVVANSLSTTSGTVAALIGAALGLLTRELVGNGDMGNAAVLVVSASASLLAVAATLRLGADSLGPDARDGDVASERADAGVRAAVRHVASRPAAALALTVIAVHRLGYGILTIATLLMFRNSFNAPEDTDAALAGLGAAVAAGGLGLASAAVLTPWATRRIGRVRWMVVLLLAAGASSLALAVARPAPWGVVGTAYVLGISAQGIKICVDATVQESVEDSYRGRVFSGYDMIFNVTFVLAAVVASVVVPASGISRPVFLVLAIAYGGAAATLLRAVSTLSEAASVRSVDRADTLG